MMFCAEIETLTETSSHHLQINSQPFVTLAAAIPSVLALTVSQIPTPEFICSFIHFELAFWQVELRVFLTTKLPL